MMALFSRLNIMWLVGSEVDTPPLRKCQTLTISALVVRLVTTTFLYFSYSDTPSILSLRKGLFIYFPSVVAFPVVSCCVGLRKTNVTLFQLVDQNAVHCVFFFMLVCHFTFLLFSETNKAAQRAS